MKRTVQLLLLLLFVVTSVNATGQSNKITNVLTSLGFEMLGDLTKISSLMGENSISKMSYVLSQSFSGQRLSKIGYEKDLRYCMQQDVIDLVPVFNKESGSIIKCT